MLRQQHDTAVGGKSTRSVPSRQGHRREAAKGFNWACAKLLFCVLIRGLQNLESPFGKVLILLVGRCYLGVLIRGSQNLGAPCEGVRLVTFCIVQKVTKKHVLGRAKSCLWQVFVRRRPPKQGELRTDVSKATMFQGDEAAKDLILLVRSYGFVR